MSNKINERSSLLSYDLKEISKWQLDDENSHVELPALQRGFVWKVNQIESLWDSLLRGFPIGSFLLSKTENGNLFLLDGQQRATSIALGYYDPWDNNIRKNKFWSLKSIPIVWIDLSPGEKTNTQKFVIRVVTQSHPWGYQRVNSNAILSISDRKNALAVFRKNPENDEYHSYYKLPLVKAFPFDADLPVPLSFLIRSISENGANWKESLIQLCKKNLPSIIKTKYFGIDSKDYFERLDEKLFDESFDNNIYTAIKNLQLIDIPGTIVKHEVLKADDEQTGDDPTLFVRLNSSGTRITGEELMYSIYKASFPEAKDLVESIGASFITPSLAISIVSRMSISEINSGVYPNPINVTDFRKKIRDENFKIKIKEFIGNEEYSSAKILFKQAFDLLLSKDNIGIPPVLVKNLVKNSPDLFLMLLYWIRINNISDIKNINNDLKKKILASITALSWFGRDVPKYVRDVWSSLSSNEFWSKHILSLPFMGKKDYCMFPLIQPSTLRKYLLQEIVENKISMNSLFPLPESEIETIYIRILKFDIEQENDLIELTNIVNGIWNTFRWKLTSCKPLVLFAQRDFINDYFGEFNQMETLEDTNTPWDWDHIYPNSWVYSKRYVDPHIREWINGIGNYRAISLEKNRSESDSLSPKERLSILDVRKQCFINENDWEFWGKINERIYGKNDEFITYYLSANIHRLCNIYEDWFITLGVADLFDFGDSDSK